MKNLIKASAVIASQFLFTHYLCAQQQAYASTSNEVPKESSTSIENKPAATQVQGKEVTITIKNDAELPVIIFAGPKEGIRDPKVQTFGGLSVNKLYLHENEVVCLLTREKKMVSCAMVKPGISSVEINSSATNLAGK